MTLSQARKEVASRTDKAIERETALKWAYRAVACYERAAREVGVKRLGWLLRAADYDHEAREHSATVKDSGRTLKKIEKMLDRAERAGHSVGRRKKR
jgi:hypothetical protein